MTRNAYVPAREPVSDILREAARPGPKLRPGTLPATTSILSTAIGESLDPLRHVEEPFRYRNALDTTVTLCAEHGGKRLVSTIEQRVERLTGRCFALYGLPPAYATRTFKRLASFCGGGIPASSPKNLANPAQDEHIRRVCSDRADCLALACRHDLAPGASTRLSIPVEA